MSNLILHKYFFYFVLLFSAFLSASSVCADPYLLQEEFKDNSNKWLVKNDKVSALSIEKNGYFITNKLEDRPYCTFLQIPDFDISRSFTYTAVILYINGADDFGRGIMFGGDLDGNYMGLVINANGFYQILEKTKGNIISLTPWTYTDYIKKGGIPNILSVTYHKGFYHFKINDQYMTFVQRGQLFGNRMGFIVGSNSTSQAVYASLQQEIKAPGSDPVISKKGIELHDVYSSPTIIPPGSPFMLNFEYTVTDSEHRETMLPVSLSYAFLQNGQRLFTETVELSAPEGKRHISQKSDIIATKSAGIYQLECAIAYNDEKRSITKNIDIR